MIRYVLEDNFASKVENGLEKGKTRSREIALRRIYNESEGNNEGLKNM